MPLNWPSFYLSFAGDEWLGACVVRAPSDKAAIYKSHALRINPGGDVIIIELTPEQSTKVPDEARERLLNKEDLEQYFGPTVQIDI